MNKEHYYIVMQGAEAIAKWREQNPFRAMNLRFAELRGANMRGANLRFANLRGAKLRGAEIPVVPRIHQTILTAVEAKPELFDMDTWHGESECGATHCRAGWAITLAGEAGKKLEEKVGPNVAEALIYLASDPSMTKVPNWTASNKEALADMREMAAAEKAAKAEGEVRDGIQTGNN